MQFNRLFVFCLNKKTIFWRELQKNKFFPKKKTLLFRRNLNKIATECRCFKIHKAFCFVFIFSPIIPSKHLHWLDVFALPKYFLNLSQSSSIITTNHKDNNNCISDVLFHTNEKLSSRTLLMLMYWLTANNNNFPSNFGIFNSSIWNEIPFFFLIFAQFSGYRWTWTYPIGNKFWI